MIRKPNSAQQPVLGGVRVTRSLYDTVIPPIQGRCRVPYLMIWTGNFRTHQEDGKKGKLSKKGGATITSYSANFDFLVGYGPCIAVGTIWRNTTQFWNAFVTSQQYSFTSSGTDFGAAVTNNPGPFINIIAITVDIPVNASFNDYGSTGPVTLSQTQSAPLYNANYTPLFVLAPGQGENYCQYSGADDPGNPNWSVHIDGGISNPVITVYYFYSPDGYPIGLSSSGANMMLEAQLGSGTEFNYPGGSTFQIIYPEFFGISAANFDLGPGGMTPNDNAEVVCMNNLSVNGDASPADFILDIITSGNYWPYNPTSSCWAHGLSFLPENQQATYTYAPNILADPPNPAPGCVDPGPGAFSLGLTSLRNYCLAYGIFISGSMDSQRTAADWINELCDIGNCTPVWNGSKLSFIPRCEVSAIGNGAIYTAPTASGPIYTIDDSVYIVGKNEDPVTVVRNENQDPRSIPNLLRIQHKSRGSGFYSDITTTWRDDASITRFGIVPGNPKNWPFIQDQATAVKCAAPVMRRYWMVESVNVKFKLPISHCLLDCYDLIALNDSALGWKGFPVRLTSMQEDDNRVISCEAEPFIYGAHAPSEQTPAATISTGFGASKNAVVTTQVNTPIIFEPVYQLTGGDEEIWFCVSDTDPNYGGCNIYMSSDGLDYTFIGALVGNSTMGSVYNSTYPSTPDPDVTDTLYVDLTESNGVLGSFSATSRDSFVPLCYVSPGGTSTINGNTVTIPYELVSYTTANLQSGDQYSLPPTIRRGVYSTPNVSHTVGQDFAYLGPGAVIFKYSLNPSLVGMTLYFKFSAFNASGGNAQDISSLTAYTITPTGLGQTSSAPSTTLNYSLSPPVVLYQGKSGGWPGVATGSSSWTDPTKVYIPPFTVSWTDGVEINYAPTSPVAIPGAAPETLYGAIYDPGRTGTGTFYLSTTNYAGQAGYINLGSIFIADTSTGGGSGGGSSSGVPYDMVIYFNGLPASNFELFRYVAVRTLSLPQNLNGSKAICKVAPTGSVTLPINHNGSQVGSVNFAANTTSGTFTFSNAVTLSIGDTFSVFAPSPQDSTFATISITFSETR